MIARSSKKLVFTKDELPQGSDAWHEFRIKGIGGSEASALMGIGFTSINELWAVKTGRASGQIEMNDAMRRGHELEPHARELYERVTGSGAMEPICMVHPEYSFMRASLDGLSEDGQLVLEIKCPGINTHTKAVRGNVPDYYIPQIQHQLMIADALFGAKTAHYYSYFPTDPLFALDVTQDGVLLVVEGDKEYQAELLKRGKMFWSCVENDIPPDPQDFKPYSTAVVVERNDSEWKQYADQFIELDAQSKRVNVQLTECVEKLKQLAEGVQADKVIGFGVQVAKVSRVGSVDYASIPELRGVNLENYRKNATTYMSIKNIGGEGE